MTDTDIPGNARFDGDGSIPAVVQDIFTSEALRRTTWGRG
jgi:hypothetical protein